MTREQTRAHEAYRRIGNVPKEEHKEYGGNCLRLPAMIHQCGLCQTLAFLQAKGAKNPAFRRILDDLAGVTGLAASGDALADATRAADLGRYQRFTREVLAGATYLKPGRTELTEEARTPTRRSAPAASEKEIFQ
jgi:CRISPR/Cas system CMR-associated protein Cmr5 small subunit